MLNIFIKGSIFDGNNFVPLHIPEGKKERKKLKNLSSRVYDRYINCSEASYIIIEAEVKVYTEKQEDCFL